MVSIAELATPPMELRSIQGARPPLHALDPGLLAAHSIIGFNPGDPQFVPYLMLRSHLLDHVQTTQTQVFAITSVQPGNGKTHVAINLAAALSRLKPTVLLDLDLRRPMVGKRLGIDHAHPGIDDVLNGEVDLAEAAVRIKDCDLTIYQARRPRANAEQLLGSPKLSETVAALRSDPRRPICIIDTPPVLVHDDLMLTARCINGVLMVVEEGRTTRRELIGAVSALNPTPVVGSILNMSMSGASGERYYNYGYQAK
jgi:Mrp family chromosome partitioning ATPase